MGLVLTLAGAPLLLFLPLAPLLGIWLIVVGVMLFRPRPARYGAAVATGVATLALALLMGAYGVFAIVMQARSAARGSGLLGGLGELVLGVALVLGLLSAVDLLYLRRARIRAAFDAPPAR